MIVVFRILLTVLFCLYSSIGFAASTARQVDFLAAGIEKDGEACSGCKVYTYESGTTTAKATYLDRDKVLATTNPIILDSEGRAEVFADGLYKFVIKTSTDASYFDIDGLDYGGNAIEFTTLSRYASLEEAISDIGSTKTVLVIDSAVVLTSNLTIPTNVTLHVFKYDSVDLNGKTLTVNGGIVAPPIEWIIGTSGTFTGSPIVQYYDPTWTKSTVTDTATPIYKSLTFGGNLIGNSISTYSLATSNSTTIYNTMTVNAVSTFNNKSTFSNTVVWHKGSDKIVAAGDNTLNLTNDGNYFDVVNTGVANIIGIQSEGIGTVARLHFGIDNDITLVNSTNFLLSNGGNITVLSGDEFSFIQNASAQWRMVGSSRPIFPPYKAGSYALYGPSGVYNTPSTTYTYSSTGAAYQYPDRPGIVCFSWESKTGNASYAAYTRIYKNNIAYGPEHSTTSTSYVPFKDCLLVSPLDGVHLRIKTANAATDAYHTNYAILTDFYSFVWHAWKYNAVYPYPTY